MKRTIGLILAFCVLLFSLVGCGNTTTDRPVVEEGEEQVEENEIGGDNASPDENSKTAEEQTELSPEEQLEAVYQNSLPMTFCIFTPTGNNGTGFLCKEKYIVTNAHVLYDAEYFTITDANGAEYKGEIIFEDTEMDIAIIWVGDNPRESVRFADSNTVEVGEQVLCIGNPFEGEPFTFCTGKRVELPQELQQSLDPEMGYLCSDAHMVSGYSGGPVFNSNGELVDICHAAFLGDVSSYGFDHLSFAIPIEHVQELIEANCK